MRDELIRKENESLVDYKERLYKNKSRYNLEWNKIGEILSKEQSNDHIRKTSYGYLECLDDIKNSTKFDKSIMFINDIHCPFERSDVLDLISKHSDEITTLVIGGDLMDCATISSFPKIERGNLIDEITYTYDFMKKIRKILNKNQKIILINGNHEERLKMQIQKMQQKNLQQFINPNVLDMIANGFQLYIDGKKKTFESIENVVFMPHWYVNIDNKIIVCHPKDFSGVDGKMCEKVSEHFLNKHEQFEIVLFGHTHKHTQMKVSRRQGVYVIENGCLCKPHDYADIGKLGYSPQDYCYTIIKYNDNEKVNLNNISVYHLDGKEEYEKQENYKVFI